VIFDVAVVIVFGVPRLHPNKVMNLIAVCALTPPTGYFPVSLPLFSPLYSLRQNNIEIRPINNLTMVSKCSRERKSHTSLTLNKILGMIKLSEEGMSKAKIG